MLSLGCGAAFSMALVDPNEEKDDEAQTPINLEDALQQGPLAQGNRPQVTSTSRPPAPFVDEHRGDRFEIERKRENETLRHRERERGLENFCGLLGNRSEFKKVI